MPTQEQIDEALKLHPPYVDPTTTEHEKVDIESRSIMYWTIVAGDKAIMDDRYLNAARSIMLEKALRELVADLNLRAKLGDEDAKGVVACGNGVWVRANATLTTWGQINQEKDK